MRVVSTAASLLVALAAVAVIDCSSTSVQLLDGDPAGICATVSPLGEQLGVWVGIGLAIVAAIALMATWVPAARPGTERRRLVPENSLSRNLSRLTEGPDDANPAPASEAHLLRLTRRLEAIESSLEGDPTPSREVTEQWMGLLRDANDLHNHGQLTTEDFKQINTRLLDLFADPSSTRVAASR